MEKRRSAGSFILQLFILLLGLSLLSLWLLGNMYARYTTQGTGGDSARVAQFQVTESGNEIQTINNIKIAPGEKREYTVTVKNDSEVAVSYSITAESKYKNLPLEFKMYKAGEASDDTVKIQKQELSNGMDNISAGDKTEHKYILQVSWPSEANFQNPDYVGKTDVIVITLKAEQID